MIFELHTGEIFEEGAMVAEGHATQVFFDPKTDEVIPRPARFLRAVARLEGRSEETFVAEQG